MTDNWTHNVDKQLIVIKILKYDEDRIVLTSNFYATTTSTQ